MKQHSSGERVSRRRFIGSAVAAAATVTIVPRWVLGGPGRVAPSDQLTYAVLGVGGMGRGHVADVLGDDRARLVAVCDVDSNHLARAVDQAGGACDGYEDFRDVLDRSLVGWLESGDGGKEVTVRSLPERDHIDIPVRESLIVELYSK